jgi:hypothetical protein
MFRFGVNQEKIIPINVILRIVVLSPKRLGLASNPVELSGRNLRLYFVTVIFGITVQK